MEPALIALIGTIFGGAGIKFIESILGRRKVKEDLATTIRNELRLELSDVKTRLDVQEEESAEWQKKYFMILEQFIQVKSELNFTLRRVKEMSDQGSIDWSDFIEEIGPNIDLKRIDNDPKN